MPLDSSLRWSRCLASLVLIQISHSSPQGFQGCRDCLLDIRVYCPVKVHASEVLEVGSEISQGDFVAWFVFSIGGIPALDCVVRQMYVPVFQVAQIIWIWWCANIAIAEEIAPEVDAIDHLCETKHSNVELSHRCVTPELPAYQQRPGNILLHHPQLAALRFQEGLHLLNASVEGDAVATIWLLSRLAYPYGFSFNLLHPLEFLAPAHVLLSFQIICLRHTYHLLLFILERILTHRHQQIRFVTKQEVRVNFAIYLIGLQFITDRLFVPLSPEEADLIKFTIQFLRSW